MGSQVTLVYTVFPNGPVSAADMATLVASAVLSPDVIAQLGLRVTSDVTAAGPPVTRTIVLSFLPSVTAAVTSTLGANTGRVSLVNLNVKGTGYVKPPQLVFGPPFPGIHPQVRGANSPTIEQRAGGPRSAIAQAFLGIDAVTVVNGGAAYGANTFIKILTPQKQGRTPAVLTPTILAGVITGVTVTVAGDGFEDVAQIIAVDPGGTGSGFIGTTDMEVNGVNIVDPGQGYNAAPTVTALPYFKMLFPDAGNQASPFVKLFAGAIAAAAHAPVLSAAPVVA